MRPLGDRVGRDDVAAPALDRLQLAASDRRPDRALGAPELGGERRDGVRGVPTSIGSIIVLADQLAQPSERDRVTGQLVEQRAGEVAHADSSSSRTRTQSRHGGFPFGHGGFACVCSTGTGGLRRRPQLV